MLERCGQLCGPNMKWKEYRKEKNILKEKDCYLQAASFNFIEKKIEIKIQSKNEWAICLELNKPTHSFCSLSATLC